MPLGNKFIKWTDFSHTYFYRDCDYLYLGEKHKRAAENDLYNSMFSHYRGDYAIFHYKKMWLNYIKKINLLKRLNADEKNYFFFISNKLEHLKHINHWASISGATTMFYQTGGQFTKWYHKKEMKSMLDHKLPGMGINSFMDYRFYSSEAHSKVFFTLSNSPQDRLYLKSLYENDMDFLIISTADADSVQLAQTVALFGNNDNLASWNFFFELFYKFSTKKTTSSFGYLDFKKGRWLKSMCLKSHYGFFDGGRAENYVFRRHLVKYSADTKIGRRRNVRAYARLLSNKKSNRLYKFDIRSQRFFLPKPFFNFIKLKRIQ